MVPHILPGDLVVCSVGQTRQWHRLCPRPLNLYLRNGMGMGTGFALGLALAQPKRRVVLLDGDGGLLMNLQCLAAIAARPPANLRHIVLHNGCYGATGQQPLPAAAQLDLVRLAEGFGLRTVRQAAHLATCNLELALLFSTNAYGMLVLHISAVDSGAPPIPFDAQEMKRTFLNGLAGHSATTNTHTQEEVSKT